MDSGEGWNAEKMLNLYLLDYFIKNGMNVTAELFRIETNTPYHDAVVNAPQGFLHDWWSLFYDKFASRQHHQAYSEAGTSAEGGRLGNYTQIFGQILPQSMINQQRPGKAHIPGDFDSRSLAPSSSLPQQQKNFTQNQAKREHSVDINLDRSFPVNPSTPHGKQKAFLQSTGPHAAGLNESVNPTSFNLSGSSGAPNLQQQFQMLNSPQRPTPTSVPSNLFFDPVADKQFLMDYHEKMRIEENQNQHNNIQQQQQDSSDDDDDDDDNVDNTTPCFRLLRPRSNPNKYKREGFTFEEVDCLQESKSDVLCCNFSSDGILIASADHDRKVMIWNAETLDFIISDQNHSQRITDICYKPNSIIFATSSFDKTVQIWNSAMPDKLLFKLVGHGEKVLSLDFHPRKVDLLCSCDSNNEMRLWNVSQRSCTHVSKLPGATRKVRFQPRFGKLIATASENVVHVIDVEKDKPKFSLTGHNKEVLSISWDPTGKYIASVSEDSARMWSVIGGECLHELHSTGNKFQCCTFHPAYLDLMVIGGYQSLQLWHPIESKTLSVEAHGGLISSLAYSPKTKLIASTSHDQCVKLWM